MNFVKGNEKIVQSAPVTPVAPVTEEPVAEQSGGADPTFGSIFKDETMQEYNKFINSDAIQFIDKNSKFQPTVDAVTSENIAKLKETMKQFKSLVNNAIYQSAVNLMLNSLTYTNFKELFNSGSGKSFIVDYLRRFSEFIYIDLSQLNQFNSEQIPKTIVITSYEQQQQDNNNNKNQLFKFEMGNGKISQSDYQNIHGTIMGIFAILSSNITNRGQNEGTVNKDRIGLCKDIKCLPSITVFETQQPGATSRVHHIFELIGLFTFCIEKGNFEHYLTETTQYNLYYYLNAFMYGRLVKLQQLMNSFNELTRLTSSRADMLNDIKTFLTENSSKLSTYIIVQNQNTCLSYLKLNNKSDTNRYNDKRFNLMTDGDSTYLQVKYNSDNKKYNYTSDEVPQFDQTYLFGKFTKIYRLMNQTTNRSITNADVANSMKDMQDKILTGDLVSVFGYGASGAGKTSSLIYLNALGVPEDRRSGILIYLCNIFGRGGKIGKQTSDIPGYDKMTITTQEFFESSVPELNSCNDINSSSNICAPQTFEFKYDQGKSQFICTKGTIKRKFGYRFTYPDNFSEERDHLLNKPVDFLEDKTMYKGTITAFGEVKDADKDDTYNITDETGKVHSNVEKKNIDFTFLSNNTDAAVEQPATNKNLGETLVYLIDTDRFVKSTTNNPNSSRSHVAIYVKMERSTSTPLTLSPVKLLDGNDASQTLHFMLVDAAGVENKFNCTDKDVWNKLLNIKDNPKKQVNESNYVPNLRRDNRLQPEKDFKYNLDTVNVVLGGKMNYETTLDKSGRVVASNSIDNEFKTQNEGLSNEIDEYIKFYTDLRKRITTKEDIPKLNSYLVAIFSNLTSYDKFLDPNKLNDQTEKTVNFTKLRELLSKIDKSEYFFKGKENTPVNIGKRADNEPIATALKSDQGNLKGKKQQSQKITPLDLYYEPYDTNPDKQSLDKILKNCKQINDKSAELTGKINSLPTFAGGAIPRTGLGLTARSQNPSSSTFGNNAATRSASPAKDRPVVLANRSFSPPPPRSTSSSPPSSSTGSQEAQKRLNDAKTNKESLMKQILVSTDLDFIRSNISNADKEIGTLAVRQRMLIQKLNGDVTTSIEEFKKAVTQAQEQGIDTTTYETNRTARMKESNIKKIQGLFNDDLKKTGTIEAIQALIESYKNKYKNTTIDYTAAELKIQQLKDQKATEDSLKEQQQQQKQQQAKLAEEKKQREAKEREERQRLQQKQDELNGKIARNVTVDRMSSTVRNSILQYGQKVCEQRVDEGIFINSTLRELRRNILEIMIEKTKDCIYYSPPFFSDCLPNYCPTFNNCFAFNSAITPAANVQTPSSLIINWAYQQYKQNSGKAQLRVDEFYKSMLICVFCVMDVSLERNNPPVAPYVNISDLKEEWNRTVNRSYEENDPSSAADIKTHADNLQKCIDAIKAKYGTYGPEISKELDSDLNTLKQPDFYKTPFTTHMGKIVDDYVKNMNGLIDILDNKNAITAMGTLEYLDSFAKLYTTNSICHKDKDYKYKLITTNVSEPQTHL